VAFISKRKTSHLRNAARLKAILSVFVRNGFHQVVEKAKLGHFLLNRFTAPEMLDQPAPVRLRRSFEELGPTFVKLGQLLATRPDLVPGDFIAEFRKLHDQVPAVAFNEIEIALVNHFGRELDEVFEEFDKNPVGAASIAQVHRAKLKDGTDVVVKVQRPGIEKTISEDLNILRLLAVLLERYVPESRPFNPAVVVEEFAKSLEFETNFVVEANNIRRFQANFANDPNIQIPNVFTEYTGRRVLVMEALNGIALSHRNALDQEGIQPETVLRRGLTAYFKMVFTDGLFHGDLHAGNLFVMPDSKIGLIDFGVVGRLNRKTQTAIANMMIALAEEDYDRLAYQYVDLAPYTERVDVDHFARDLRDLIAPYFGLTLKHVNVGRLLLDSTVVASKYGLILPGELVLFFKSIVTIEGMGRIIMGDFDFMAYSLEFASDLVKSRYDSAKLLKEATYLSRDVNSLISVLPRQLRQLFRRVNNPDWEMKVSIAEVEYLRRSVQKAADLTFLGLVIAGLTISGALFMGHPTGVSIAGLPVMSAIMIGGAALLGLLAFLNYIRRS
jgi:ubiquinone biosynthesis protein